MAETLQTARSASSPLHVDLTAKNEPADLTIVESRVGNLIRLILVSKLNTPVEADIEQPDSLHDFINAHYAEMERHGRGSAIDDDAAKTVDRQYAADYASGFGDELYDKFAPAVFKDLFWKIADAHRQTDDMIRIQVLSDDPSIPWELMRPARPDGSGRRTFLGLDSVITRWHMSNKGRQRPPQVMGMNGVSVIAPTYQGNRALPAVNGELAALQQVNGYQLIKGNYADVRALARNLPQGIVHFAGHGGVIEKNGVPQFVILLQDAQLEPSTWTSLPGSGPDVHPLFFFNACDVGEARRFMNGVDGWAPALLDSGASGYIGALWSVNDQVASTFAANFYDLLKTSMGMSGSVDVPMILTRARARTYKESADPTALAYVMYSDPSLKMVR